MNTKVMKVSDLQMDENYSKIYELKSRQFELLKESIRKNGVLTPIIVNRENIIISGSQRFQVCLELNINEVNVIICEKESEDILQQIIEHNNQRVKSAMEIWREIEHLKIIHKPRRGYRSDLEENSTEFERKTLRGKLSQLLDISETQIHKIETIGNVDVNLLNLISDKELSINKAYSEAKRIQERKAPKKAENSVIKIDKQNVEKNEFTAHYCTKCGHTIPLEDLKTMIIPNNIN